ncbi:MAG: hypothetical protein K0Q53_2622 [Massilibacillus sp.]|jgi:hypothetical protein|nr:hypothetical protein [Massilibacillus sp.]
MYRIYKTTNDTIIAVAVNSNDITVKLLIDLDKKEYVLVKRQEEVNIYNLSLVGHVTEIADDISFEEFKEITYAKLDKELLEMGITPRKMETRNFDWTTFEKKKSN